MLALMNNPQCHSHLRAPTSLNENITDIRESSKVLSSQTNLLCDTTPSLYTTYNKLNIDANEFERLQKLANGFKNVIDNTISSKTNTGIDSSNHNKKTESIPYPIELDDLIISSHNMKKPNISPLNLVNIIKSPQVLDNVKPIQLLDDIKPIQSHSVHSQVSNIDSTQVHNIIENTRSMNPLLRNLIRSVSDNNTKSEHTHVTLYDPHARWTIPNENISAFWTGYCDLIDQEESNLCMAERPQQIMPLISKFTFKFNLGTEHVLQSPEFSKVIQWICHIYQTVVSECFHVSECQIELAAAVLQSSTHWYIQDLELGQTFIMYEIKLQFPYCHIDAGMQNRAIRPRVIQLLRNNNVLSLMKVRPTDDWDQIISADIINSPVTMYGSSEIYSKPLLELKHIWGHITSKMLTDDIQPMEVNLEDAFVPQNHLHVQQQLLSSSIFEDPDIILSHWIPLFLSVNYYCQELKSKTEVQDYGRFKNQNRLISGETLPVQLTLQINRGPDIFGEMIEFAKRIQPIDNHKEVAYSKLRKAFMYIYSTNNTDFPYKSATAFNKALKAYQPWKIFLVDNGSNKEKIRVSFPDSFMKASEEWWITQRPVFKPAIDAELWNSLPLGTDIPDTRINFRDGPDVTTLRSYAELIGNRTRSCTLYISAPGCGKTETMCSHLTTLHPSIPILCPSFRIALSEKQKADLNGLGVAHYLDPNMKKKVVIRMDEDGRLIIQIDSICKVIGPITNGYLIIDEIESLIEHIFSSIYIKDRSRIIKRLTEYIRNAAHVWVADANASMSTVKFLEQICGREVIIYKSDYIRNPRQAFFIPGKGALKEAIINAINSNDKVYIPTNSNNYAKYLFNLLQARCPGKAGKLYNKDTMIIKDDNNIVDPVEDFINYDYVIVTPKFQAGNSFTKEHFTRVYSYWSGASCSPEASTQLLTRVRNLSDSNIYMYIDNRLGGSKVALHDVDTFEQMRDKVVRQSAASSSAHNFVLSNKDIAVIDMDIFGQVNMNDPTTFLMVVHKYNANRGYKNYTHRMISLLKGMGYTFGGNLSTGSHAEEQLEKETTKDISRNKREAELQDASVVAATPLINHEQAAIIQSKIQTQDETLTPEETASIKKYRLFETVKLLRPDSPEDIVAAKKIKRPKQLMTKLLETARIDSPQDELRALESCLMELANVKALEPGIPKIERKFYDMEAIQKAALIGYLLSAVRMLGFKGFFDPLYIAIDKDASVRYIVENREKIEDLVQIKFTTSQLTNNGIIKWLNSKLYPLLSIKITALSNNKEYRRFIIDSPWRIDTSGIQPKILHHPLETDITYENYLESYATTMGELINKILPKQLPLNFEQCYDSDPNYPGSIIITDIIGWNRFISQNKDITFQQKAHELYQGYLLYRNYQDYIMKNVSMGNNVLSWYNYKILMQKPKPLALNIVDIKYT